MSRCIQNLVQKVPAYLSKQCEEERVHKLGARSSSEHRYISKHMNQTSVLARISPILL